MGKHFLSYSHRDGAKFAFRLRDELLVGEPSIEAWIDAKLNPGDRWPGALGDAVSDCETLLFVMTPDSVDPQSVCGDECSRAMRFKKPIVPLLFAPGLVPPFLLETTQYIDFTDSLEKGLARLRLHLGRLDSPEGQLDQLRQRMRYAERDLRSAAEGDRARIEKDIADLKSEIDRQQLVAADPEKAAQQTQQTIAQGMERERQPAVPVAAGPRPKFINQPAATAPSHFQNRHVETKLLGDFLSSGDGRMATVIGRGGTGKTAMVCRMLKSLETGELPDSLGSLPVDGIVYLSAAGSQRVDAPRVFESICKLLTDREAERLRAMAQDSQVTVDGLFTALLADFPSGRTVLLLDNFETLVQEDGQRVRDAALGTALKTILEAPEHCLKVVITTRIAPNDLILTQPGRQWTIQLEKGLESPYAENVLRALDRDGTLGIRDADAAVLDRARERTRGFPRALEMLVGALKADRTMSLEEILDIAGQALPESVVDVLVGEAFRRLDRPAQEIVEGLAIFGLPVPATALDYLLQPFHPASNSEPVLKRLVNMEFVRYEKGRYFLHPVDGAFAGGRIPAGEATDRAAKPPVWTRAALFSRAADYYAQVRIQRDRCQSISDIAAQLAEIDMRCAGGDYDGAAGVAVDIDGLLERWGYFRLRQSILTRMTGKISDQWMKACHALSCSGASMRLGDLDAAIQQAQQALDLGVNLPNAFLQAWAKVALGNCVTETGQADRAITLLEDAIKLAAAQQSATPEQALFVRSLEHLALFNLSRCYIHLGNTSLALSYLRKAAEISVEIKDVDNQPLLFNNIANALGRMGQYPAAIDAARKGLEYAGKLKSRLSECCNLTNLGMLQIDTGDLPGAIESLTRAVEIADEVFNRQFQDESREPLALAYLCTQNLDKAREIAEEALRYSAIQQNQPRSGLLAFLGIIALRQGDKEKARGWFRMAVDEAKEMLTRNPKHFAVMEAQGLASCGQFACGDAADLTEAIAAYRAARALTKDAGIVKRALRLFDALRVAIPGGDLEVVRGVVAGQSI